MAGVYIRVNSQLYSKRYPLETPIGKMKDWRQSKRVGIKAGALIAAEEAEAGQTMEEDIRG